MRYATDINLESIIVHIVNPWQSGGLVLSERTLPLDGNERLVEYFSAHIQNSLRDPAAKAASFLRMEDGDTSGVCRGLLDGSVDLVEGSRWLAVHLRDIIARDRRISSGDLAVCFYKAGNRPDVPRYLALLKIDPTEVLRHRTERDAKGVLYVSFDVESDVMPTTRERLQKCAFLRALEPRPEYDMILLDRQIGPSRDRLVARFFIEDFLGAEFTLDPRQRTERLYKSLVNAHNQLRDELEPDQDQSLRGAIDLAVALRSIDVDSWIGSLPISDEHKAVMDEIVSRELPDRQFEIDSTYADKLLRRRYFGGDFGLRVEMRAENYDQVVRSVEHVKQPGKPDHYRIVLTTKRWEEETH